MRLSLSLSHSSLLSLSGKSKREREREKEKEREDRCHRGWFFSETDLFLRLLLLFIPIVWKMFSSFQERERERERGRERERERSHVSHRGRESHDVDVFSSLSLPCFPTLFQLLPLILSQRERERDIKRNKRERERETEREGTTLSPGEFELYVPSPSS